MQVVIVARDEIGPVELFDLVLRHRATAVIDLHERPLSSVPPSLKHIYQHPSPRLAASCLARLARHWPCAEVCHSQIGAGCECEYVVLLLAADGHAAEARELMKRVRPHAQMGDVSEGLVALSSPATGGHEQMLD
ncbi:hypothetical protein ANRL4_01411 [Anaerolineae bacterium]|nr:hypothetical protein ANRL4_01411 [Anaerolineae bacterium]